ncbi:SGNH/GDSL hydrolase family protein [Vibrio marisflavi]|uniref:SGNH/GDSL hydrolase family protein n=1 Tax=Vibrio marisflavi TaxID=1216040 RepID=UPI001F1D9C20|nr:SGNH/GDSL hydrolase family protein [Vibrio marisflavi]
MRTLFLSTICFNVYADPPPIEPITTSNSLLGQSNETYTYVRCWYRPAQSHDDSTTSWEWAVKPNGNYYSIDGYWKSDFKWRNMFYTNTSQQEIKQRCSETLGVTHNTADILFFASDNRFSYNHTIWTNDSENTSKINKMISFGDSLSDTGNIFNASQWLFPNPNTWFLEHFSNGFVWTEYLAEDLNIPVYNWAVGGAAGENQYGVLTGVNEQVKSYIEYMKAAENYDPANTLFTLEFGLNDFMNYDRSLIDVEADFSSAMTRLTGSGAQNILLMTLPDATYAPQSKYSTEDKIAEVRAKIIAFNKFIEEQAQYYQSKGINVLLFDTYSLFDKIIHDPQAYGFENSRDACLDINRSSSKDYLTSHSLTNECANYGSDKYVFWGVTHPTTAMHKYIADKMYPYAEQVFTVQ